MDDMEWGMEWGYDPAYVGEEQDDDYDNRPVDPDEWANNDDLEGGF